MVRPGYLLTPHFSGTHGQPPVAPPIRVIPRIPYLLEVVRISIDYEMRLDFSLIKAGFEASAPIALQLAGEHVHGVAVSRAPVGVTGHLTGDSGVTTHGAGLESVTDIKFPGPYSAYQQRGKRWDGTHIIRNRPGGGMTGFLELTMVDQRDAAIQIIADTMRELS